MRAIVGISVCLGVASGILHAGPKHACEGMIAKAGLEKKVQCQAPFYCNDLPPKEGTQAATDDGHADWTNWCDQPLLGAALKCYEGNLTAFANVHAEVNKRMGLVTDKLDAAYCNQMGHCGYIDGSPVTNSGELTENTTLAEAEKVCDARFGHDAWTTFTASDADAKWKEALPYGGGAFGGKLNPSGSYARGKLACAQGTYHCDVIYCRQYLCNNPDFAEFIEMRPNKTWEQAMIFKALAAKLGNASKSLKPKAVRTAKKVLIKAAAAKVDDTARGDKVLAEIEHARAIRKHARQAS